MTPQNEESECPVCHNALPKSKDGSAAEAHISTCIESQLANSMAAESLAPVIRQPVEEDRCPICSTSFKSKEFDGSDAARESHVVACIDSHASGSSQAANDTQPPMYQPPPEEDLERLLLKTGKAKRTEKDSEKMFGKTSEKKSEKMSNETSEKSAGQSSSATASAKLTKEPVRGGTLSRLFSGITGPSKLREEKVAENMLDGKTLMYQRWGAENSQVFQMAMRYWTATRMQKHWNFLLAEHPRQFRKHLEKGYMEPIPTAWVQSRALAWPYPEGSYYETPAEKRLYYLLNNGVLPDGSSHPPLRPLNIYRDRNTIIRRGNERNARQRAIDPERLAKYKSPGDVFHGDKQIKSHNYSAQVQNVVYAARAAALHELADGIIHGTDHLETMLLIDVSSSMTWNPHSGIPGPDGLTRYHDQVSNIRLVEHLVHRVLHHMIPRQQKEHPEQRGIDTVTFSTYGRYAGQLSAQNFKSDWRHKVPLGGGTQVMQGWQVVKATYFEHQHSRYGHGRYDPVFGWQPTPGMPKLSLLVFLDGEAQDMDEFELELLGETWAYVTIALVGMENCPHHHSHAIELERVAKFNPHVGFYDVHGRVCERLVVEDILSSVYPVDCPSYEEILKPEYDLPAEELPAYSAY